MTEIGEVGEKRATAELPATYNHLGTDFESPEVNDHVFDALGRHEERRTTATLSDLLPIVRTEKREIEKQKLELAKDALNKSEINQGFEPAEQKLRRVENALVALAAGTKNRTDDEIQDLLTDYIDRHMSRLEKEGKKADSDEDELTAERNRGFFQNIREELTSNVDELAAIEEQATITSEQVQKERAELPDQKYKPKTAAELLDELKHKGEVSFADVQGFIKAVEKDIPPYNEQLIQAVDKAREFLEEHKEEDKGKRKVVVTVSASGDFEAKWQNRIFKRRQDPGKQWIFNPNGDYDDPKGLDTQAFESFRNKQWKDDIAVAEKALEKLKAKQKLTAKEKLALFQQIERYGKLEVQKTGRKADDDKLVYLEKMSAFIKGEIGPEDRNDLELAA